MSSIEPYSDDEFTDIELTDLDENVARREFNDGSIQRLTPQSHPVVLEPLVAADQNPASDHEPEVDAAMSKALTVADRLREHGADLDSLADAELVDHVEFYQRAHGELQRALSDIDHG